MNEALIKISAILWRSRKTRRNEVRQKSGLCFFQAWTTFQIGKADEGYISESMSDDFPPANTVMHQRSPTPANDSYKISIAALLSWSKPWWPLHNLPMNKIGTFWSEYVHLCASQSRHEKNRAIKLCVQNVKPNASSHSRGISVSIPRCSHYKTPCKENEKFSPRYFPSLQNVPSPIPIFPMGYTK